MKKRSEGIINIHTDILFLLPLLIGSLMVLILTAFPADVSAAGPPPDQECKSCHVGSSNEVTLPSGETFSVDVNLETLAQSVHGHQTGEGLLCTDCHSPSEYQYPHEPLAADTLAEYERNAAEQCQDCHVSLQQHNPGHLLAEDNPNLPTCTNCHGGGHEVVPADPLAENPVAMCRSCHETFEDPKIGQVHQELIASMGPDQTCQTCHADHVLYPPETQCILCHEMLESDLALENGDTIPLHVEAETILNSVHGERQFDDDHGPPVLCTDCHTDQARYGFPHQPITPGSERLFAIEMSGLCEQCHEGIATRQMDSTHAMALAAGNLDAATCVDCHGSHAIENPDEPRGRISQTCGQCHSTINEQYAMSVHGAALLGEDNPDVPVCIDCHGVHNIEDPTTALFRVRSPELCATCHANEELMNKYDISTNVFNSYVADFHGTTVTLFEKQSPDHETNKAVCYDCHGVHNILPATDENSQIIRQNLLETCQQCHPDATANFSDAWTSHFEPSLEHNPLIYFVNLFYAILIPAVVGGFVIFIAADGYRRIRTFWRNR